MSALVIGKFFSKGELGTGVDVSEESGESFCIKQTFSNVSSNSFFLESWPPMSTLFDNLFESLFPDIITPSLLPRFSIDFEPLMSAKCISDMSFSAALEDTEQGSEIFPSIDME